MVISFSCKTATLCEDFLINHWANQRPWEPIQTSWTSKAEMSKQESKRIVEEPRRPENKTLV